MGFYQFSIIRWLCTAVCLLILPLAGCRWPWQPEPVQIPPGPPPVTLKMFHQALEAYQAGDFATAAQLFSRVREQTADTQMARAALFGMSCSQLMDADTPEKYREALQLWELWMQCAPHEWDRENPLLFAPLIQEKMLFSNLPLTAQETRNEESNMVPQWLLVNAQLELEKLKAKLAAQLVTADQNIQKREEKIKTLEKEIAKLKSQINAFESIDQKIQKKKNAIPSTN